MALRSAAAVALALGLVARATDDPTPPPGLGGTAWHASRLSDGSAVADLTSARLYRLDDGALAIEPEGAGGALLLRRPPATP